MTNQKPLYLLLFLLLRCSSVSGLMRFGCTYRLTVSQPAVHSMFVNTRPRRAGGRGVPELQKTSILPVTQKSDWSLSVSSPQACTGQRSRLSESSPAKEKRNSVLLPSWFDGRVQELNAATW